MKENSRRRFHGKSKRQDTNRLSPLPKAFSFKRILSRHQISSLGITLLSLEIKEMTAKTLTACHKELERHGARPRVGDEERRFHASSPSTSGKTHEKPSYIQIRQTQCTIEKRKRKKNLSEEDKDMIVNEISLVIQNIIS